MPTSKHRSSRIRHECPRDAKAITSLYCADGIAWSEVFTEVVGDKRYDIVRSQLVDRGDRDEAEKKFERLVNLICQWMLARTANQLEMPDMQILLQTSNLLNSKS